MSLTIPAGGSARLASAADPQERALARRVLIVEDDASMATALRDGFGYEGYQVLTAEDGEAGLKAIQHDNPDVVILDVMLPRLSGLDVLKRVRREGREVPIIMLTARGQEIDKVVGLRQGADDYVTKPCGFMELMARVEAVLRRSGGLAHGLSRYEFGDVQLDFASHEASKAGEPLELTPREFKLLSYFVEHRGKVVSRDELLNAVWGYDSIPFTRTVDMHIAKLRKKIEDRPRDPRWILTVHRVGYKFMG